MPAGFQDLQGAWIHLTRWMASGTERLEATFTQFVDQNLGKNTPCRVSGAQDQYFMHNSETVRYLLFVAPVHGLRRNA